MSQRGEKRKSKKRKERERRIQRRKNVRRGPVPIEDLPPAGERAVPEFSPFALERMLLEASRSRQGKAFASSAELRTFLENLLRMPPDQRLRSIDGDPCARAQELAYLSMETTDREQAQLYARAAVALDSDCCDALAVLAIQHSSITERLEMLELAVRAGERALGGQAYFAHTAGHFWGAVETRPYMRTRQALADQLRGAGLLEEAAFHYREMLRLNPNDNQDIRCTLLGLLLERCDAPAAAELLDLYSDDGSASWHFGRVLERFLAGDLPGASRALRRARRRNEHVEEELLSQQPLHPLEQRYTLGSESEATVVRHELGRAWRGNRAALEWLADGGCATTESERRAARASYAPPVAALLTRDEAPELEADAWRAPPPAGLMAADVPELIRMAVDPALHESTGAAAWAPLHAWRALAALRAGDAAAPLTDLLRDLHDDEQVASELPIVLGALSPASIAAASRLLADPDAEERSRELAARALQCIAAFDPTSSETIQHLLLAELRRHEKNGRGLNACLIAILVEAASEAARRSLPLIQQVFDSRRVDEAVCGSWTVVRRRLSSRHPSRPTRRRSD